MADLITGLIPAGGSNFIYKIVNDCSLFFFVKKAPIDNLIKPKESLVRKNHNAENLDL